MSGVDRTLLAEVLSELRAIRKLMEAEERARATDREVAEARRSRGLPDVG